MPLLIRFVFFFFSWENQGNPELPKSPLDMSWEDQSWGCCPAALLLVGELGEVVLPVDIFC